MATGVQGTTVLIDAADATSSGASGDSNAILAAVLKRDFPGRGLFPIVDAPAVQAAFAAGVGCDLEPARRHPRSRSISAGDSHRASEASVWQPDSLRIRMASVRPMRV
ncbi:MAG: MlrC C-terminal domain-containing protein [Thermomicrobiales bacterium]